MTTTDTLHSREAQLQRVSQVAREAGRLVMAVYATAFEVRDKHDASPVTLADERAEQLIVAALARLTPDIPVVAEELHTAGKVSTVSDRFWLVDPLDGTKEFISRNGEFTVNIALIEGGRPALGVVFAPALGAAGRLFLGAAGCGAWLEDDAGRRPIHCRPVPEAGLTVVASRSHGDADALRAWLGQRRVAALVSAGSSLKLCLVAAGEADLYPRLGPTMEWDIAAGHAIVDAAGGSVTALDDGQALRYGKPGFRNPAFVASADLPT